VDVDLLDVAVDAGQIPPRDLFAVRVEPLLLRDPERERHLVDVPGFHQQHEVVDDRHARVELRFHFEADRVLAELQVARLGAGEGHAFVVDEERRRRVAAEGALERALVDGLVPAALVGAAVHLVRLPGDGGVPVEVGSRLPFLGGADFEAFDGVGPFGTDQPALLLELRPVRG
jgi:hypothetical protein